SLKDKRIKIIIRHLLIITVIFFPGLIFDFYFAGRFFELTSGKLNILIQSGIMVTPIYYLVTNIILIGHFFKFIVSSIETKANKILLFCEKNTITNREKEIIELLIKGKTNIDIAKALFISLTTVKTHIQHIFEKSNARNRGELVSLIQETI
ncbi:response regulator transcription factor, partial [Candidatus Margulisiibacteriota bacterium]